MDSSLHEWSLIVLSNCLIVSIIINGQLIDVHIISIEIHMSMLKMDSVYAKSGFVWGGFGWLWEFRSPNEVGTLSMYMGHPRPY